VRDSNTDTETPEFVKIYEQAGVDAINVTGGWHESRVPQLPMHLPRAAFAFLALNVKKAVSVPIIASNRISDPNSAERIIKDGCADMVNLGRVLIADPEWPRKALEGRVNEIRPCVGCSQGCTDEVFNGRAVFCVGNARAGFEGDRQLLKTDNPKRVMIIGAGASGLEAARPLLPQIDGYDDPCVYSAWQVLKRNPVLGKSVAVIGGGSVGLETAVFIAAKGTLTPETLHFLFAYEALSPERLRELMFKGSSNVTVFEMLPRIGQDVGKSTRWILFDNLKRYKISVKTGAKVRSIADGVVKFEKDGREAEKLESIHKN
jgi:hypothetical protein